MLVVISDLHFIDSTAGKHNINSEWFKNVFENFIPGLARRKQAKELKVLLMGDIVDLIRTEKWLDGLPEEDRPWGENGRSDIQRAVEGEIVRESKTEKRCLEILGEPADLDERGDHDERKQTIFARNAETFDLFKNGLAERVREEMNVDDDFKVELIYLPGNHDRLCNLYPEVRDRVRDALSLTINEDTVQGDPGGDDWWYRHEFKDADYGVYARHGHEYDYWNYGGGNDYSRAGQLQASVGDVMATEFAVKVPWLVGKYAEESPGSVPGGLVARLQEADNVRPVGSVVEWFYYSIGDRDTGKVRKVLDKALLKTGEDLLQIDLVRQWRSPETYADEVLRALGSPWLRWLPSTLVKTFEAEDLLTYFAKRASNEDTHAEAAYSKESVWKQEDGIRYVLYGHTHNPVIHPLDVTGDRREVIYINTGTWRNRILKTVPLNNSPQFYLLDQITYLVFYREDEDMEEKQPGTLSYDMWTGSGKKILA